MNSTDENGREFDLDEDVRGGRCPLPMLRAKRALSKLEKGQIVRVISTDPNSHDDFVLMLKHVDHELVTYVQVPCAIEKYDSEYHFYIQKG